MSSLIEFNFNNKHHHHFINNPDNNRKSTLKPIFENFDMIQEYEVQEVVSGSQKQQDFVVTSSLEETMDDTNDTSNDSDRTMNSSSLSSSEGSEDNDLTNLNWLQDGDLLKKVYCTNTNGKTEEQNRNEIENMKSTSQEYVLGWNHLFQQATINNTSQNKCEKPPYSYSALIFMAIESSPTKLMMVRDIYKWIMQNYPYFSTAPSGWKNTIRHTLSLRKCFKKIDISDFFSKKDIKGGFWYVDPEYRSILQQQVSRISCDSIVAKSSTINSPKTQSQEVETHISGTPPDQGNQKLDSHSSFQNRNVSIPLGVSSPLPLSSPSPSLNDNNNNYNHSPKTKLIKMNSNYFQIVLNSNSVRFDNSGNICRNLVSVISVNQSPKLYAPIPMLSQQQQLDTNNVVLSTNNNQQLQQQQQQRRKHYFNLLKDRQNVCSNHWHDHLATSGFEPIAKKHSAQLVSMENNDTASVVCIQNLKHDSQTNGNPAIVAWKKNLNAITNEKHQQKGPGKKFTRKFSLETKQKIEVNRNKCMKVNDNKFSINNTTTTTNNNVVITEMDDEDDGITRDGAQALLNFASKSFRFNFIN